MGRRLDHRPGLEDKAFDVYTKVSRPHAKDGEGERWAGDQKVTPTLNSFDMSDTHAVTLVGTLNSNRGGGWRYDADQVETLQISPPPSDEDPLLPMGFDSNRYRCCGNGVVSPVAEWIGRRMAESLR